MTQILIPEESGPLITMPLSGSGCCTHLSALKIDYRSPKRRSSVSPGCQAFCPHVLPTALHLPDVQEQLPMVVAPSLDCRSLSTRNPA